MKRLIPLILLGLLVSCVQEIPIEELEEETFVDTPSESQTPPAPIVDTIAPVIVSSAPMGTQPASTKSLLLQITTNEASECRYDLSDKAYGQMLSIFSSSNGGISHMSSMAVTNDTSYRFYVRCKDIAGNVSTVAHQINFYIDKAGMQDTVAPTISNVMPMGELASGTKSVVLSLSSSESSQCRYSASSSASFDQMTALDSANGLSHSKSISSLMDGTSYQYYLYCKDLAGNMSSKASASFSIKRAELDGVALYNQHCLACHGSLGNLANSNIKNKSAADIDNAIKTRSIMSQLRGLFSSAQLQAMSDVLKYSVVQAPTILAVGPEGTVFVPDANNIQINLVATTDIQAHCRYQVGGISGFSAMTKMNQTDGTNHSHVLSGLTLGDKSVSIKCGPKSDSTEGLVYKYANFKIELKVPDSDLLAPNILSFSPNGTKFMAGTNAVSLSVTTNENSECRYSNSAITPYSGMLKMASTGTMNHQQSLTSLSGGSYLYTVRCADAAGNISNSQSLSFDIESATLSKDQLRASVRQVLDNNCIACHGQGAQYQSVVDLAVDVKVLEKNTKLVTVQDPDNSYLYKKVTTGSMAKYLTDLSDRQVIYDWIKAVDGQDEINLNCAQGEEPLDNVCVKVGKTVRSYGYRMVTPDELFKDINTIFKVSLSNKDPVSGQPIVPEPQTTHGFDNQFGLVAANSVYVNAISQIADMLEQQLMVKSDFEPSVVSCMSDTVVNCGMAISGVYLPKVFRRELSATELQVYRNYFESAKGTKKEIYINYFKALVQSPGFLFREEHGTGGVAPSSPSSSGPQITELYLIDASNAQVIGQIPIGSSVEVNLLAAGSQLSIEARGSNLQSVRFTSTNHEQTESAAPYAFAGDDGVNFYPWTLPIGTHTVTVNGFSERAGAGTAGPSVNFSLKILNQAGAPKLKVLSNPGTDSTFDLDAYEIASRMAYFLTGQGPDNTLRAKAKDGSIMQKAVRIAEAERLMATSSAQQHLAEVFMESIGIKKLAHAEALASDMLRETRTILREIFFSNRKWTDVFTTNYTYVNKRLADIYNYNVNTDNANFVKVNYPDNKRSGILAHASYLSAFYSGKDISLTKDIRRGINFYEKILCRNMPLPPADVDIDLDPAANLNGCRVDNRKNSTLSPQGTCIQCHQHFDRIGLGFERFNNLGEYRTVQENDSSCSTIEDFYLDGATQFTTMPEFTQAVSENKNVGRCLAIKMKSYAYGSEISSEDLKSIFLEMDSFKTSMNFKDLIKDIVSNDQFVKRESRDEN